MIVVEDESQQTVRMTRLMRHGAISALTRLGRAARGEEVFDSDHQIRACIALARLAPCLVNPANPIEPPRSIAHPDVSPDEVERLLNELENSASKQEAA